MVIVKSALKRYNKLGFLAYNPKDKYKGGSLKWDVPMGMQEGKLNEGTNVTLPNGVKVKTRI